jgi:uncharacterized membrane protein YdjX (TVP38/TMEM64 family)
MRRLAAKKGQILVGLLGLGLCGLGVLALAQSDLWAAAEAVSMLERSWDWVRGSHPVLFFSVLSIATLFPIPISAFYVAAGPLYGIGPALLGSLVAVAANMTLAHWATSSLLRPFAVRLMDRLGYTLPAVASDRQSQAIIITRVTPGIPYFAQNLILGLLRVDYWRSLAISLPIQMLWATGFVLLGDSAMRGQFGTALSALGLLVVAGHGTRWLHRRLVPGEPVEFDPILEQRAGETS